MSKAILITGGTGFLGTEIISDLVRETNETIYVLIRAEDEEMALHKMKAAWYHLPLLCEKIGEQLIPVIGDFTKKRLGLCAKDRNRLRDEVSYVIHAGAQIGFQTGEQELMSVNYAGTGHMLAFAKTLPGLQRFVHISTAYVAGQKSGLIMENESPGTRFSSLYEKSKAKAEALVKKSGLPFVICRPGMIVGDSKTGRVKNFNTIYYVLKQLLLGKMPIIPVSPDMRLNLVPVDYVAQAVVRIVFSDTTENKVFHLTCPYKLQPRVDELVSYVRRWAAHYLSESIPKPAYLPMDFLKYAGLLFNQKSETKKKSQLTNFLMLLPYFYGRQIFDRSNTEAFVEAQCPDWRAYINAILQYACRKNFMRQTGQTVFEQAQVRRESRRYPIRYYDVTKTEIRGMSGQYANRKIQTILDALWEWGIRKGDRVALTGINSVDYMMLDQAIGLLGAVSLAIYYTTPVKEASLLLQKSGATWFFVGDTRIMNTIERLEADVKIVAFSAGLEIEKPGVMPWDDFLKKANETAPVQYVDPDALATIRYTSGTTGEPKGVMFNFAQLAWMGEVLTNLLGWKDRNRSMRYLSFLPQSHVVEGILAAYAPYYVLCKVDYFYLNQFDALTDALPRVKPNVFFSVPRFYEKLWEQICENRIGKIYLKMDDGTLKQLLGTVLRYAVLKKAGLSHCGQLIVGSAPVSEKLLLDFRALGIEIYNAYGQTEAPLITINRAGDNVIPTIGTPLPDTVVTAKPDGELIVEGPQVALGYYGLETETIQNGVLMTGDLGIIHENGHITLHGRKKDMIVTAYGKNISIPKIEERLKNIPGVSEAVLIGENRPYCTALIWVENELDDLETEIRQVNENLSSPEQIRKYCVIDRPLSIEAEELTPNLKVKRKNVEQHFAQEIEGMYQ